jgi:hypothetical protein
VYNYRLAGWPIAIFSERHSFPPYNFAKKLADYLQWFEASIQYLSAQYLSAIFHLTCTFDKWMSNKLCLKGLSLGQNFIRNDLIRVIVMAAARCDIRTRTMIQSCRT